MHYNVSGQRIERLVCTDRVDVDFLASDQERRLGPLNLRDVLAKLFVAGPSRLLAHRAAVSCELAPRAHLDSVFPAFTMTLGASAREVEFDAFGYCFAWLRRRVGEVHFPHRIYLIGAF